MLPINRFVTWLVTSGMCGFFSLEIIYNVYILQYNIFIIHQYKISFEIFLICPNILEYEISCGIMFIY